MEVRSITKSFYEVTSRVERTSEDGMQKVVKDTIVVSAVSFSDAEKKTTEFYEGEALEKVCAIKEAAYREYVKRTDITPHFSFYKVTVGMITLNEVTGKEKTTKVAYLVNADTTKEAQDIINTMFNKTMIDYKIIAVQESTVTDVVLE